MIILFATDIHGSTLVFEKALSAVQEFDVDLFILGGDVSGKRLIPIVPSSGEKYRIFEPFRQKDDTGTNIDVPIEKVVAKSDMKFYLKRLEAKGHYWHIAEEGEVARLNTDTQELRMLFDSKIYDRLCEWAEIATRRLPAGVRCVWTGGNDDDGDLLERVATTNLLWFAYSEGQLTEVEGYEIASLGYRNPTPFDTSRELSEPELLKSLVALAGKAKTTEKLLLNVHVPPVNCGSLD